MEDNSIGSNKLNIILSVINRTVNNPFVSGKLHIILSVITFGSWLPIYAAYYLFRRLSGSTLAQRNQVKQTKQDTEKIKRDANKERRKELIAQHQPKGYKKGGKFGNSFILECNHLIVASAALYSGIGLIGKQVYCDVCKDTRRVAAAVKR